MARPQIKWSKLSPCENKCNHPQGVIVLATQEGDPEGIRTDTFCPVCKTAWGCSKSSRFKLDLVTTLNVLEESLEYYPSLQEYIPPLQKQYEEEVEKEERKQYERLKAKFEPESNEKKPNERVSPDDCLMTIEEFKLSCESNLFVDDDGYGYPSDGNKMLRQVISPSKFRKMKLPSWATHIVWFNA